MSDERTVIASIVGSDAATVQTLLNDMDHRELDKLARIVEKVALFLRQQAQANAIRDDARERELIAFEANEEDIMRARYAGGID